MNNATLEQCDSCGYLRTPQSKIEPCEVCEGVVFNVVETKAKEPNMNKYIECPKCGDVLEIDSEALATRHVCGYLHTPQNAPRPSEFETLTQRAQVLRADVARLNKDLQEVNASITQCLAEERRARLAEAVHAVFDLIPAHIAHAAQDWQGRILFYEKAPLYDFAEGKWTGVPAKTQEGARYQLTIEKPAPRAQIRFMVWHRV